MLVNGFLTGDGKTINLAHASVRSWIAVLYLLVFGSLIAFTAYVWLLRATTPARASTYAYVNPVVAVFLGWLLAGELVTPRMILAMGVIIAAVVLIITRHGEAVPETLLHFDTAPAGVEDGLGPSKYRPSRFVMFSALTPVFRAVACHPSPKLDNMKQYLHHESRGRQDRIRERLNHDELSSSVDAPSDRRTGCGQSNSSGADQSKDSKPSRKGSALGRIGQGFGVMGTWFG